MLIQRRILNGLATCKMLPDYNEGFNKALKPVFHSMLNFDQLYFIFFFNKSLKSTMRDSSLFEF